VSAFFFLQTQIVHQTKENRVEFFKQYQTVTNRM